MHTKTGGHERGIRSASSIRFAVHLNIDTGSSGASTIAGLPGANILHGFVERFGLRGKIGFQHEKWYRNSHTMSWAASVLK
jgi:hypothetical protein